MATASIRLALSTVTVAAALGLPPVARSEQPRWERLGPYGGRVFSLAIDPTAPATIYAGTSDGVFVSTDGAAHWTPSALVTGRDDPVFDAVQIVLDPNDPATLYARGGSGRWLSRDRGRTWMRFREFTEMQQEGVTEVPDLLIDPGRPETLYAAGGCGGASYVRKSTDGGWNWTYRNLDSGGGFGGVCALAMDPSDGLTLYAGTRLGPVLKTEDGGDTWRRLAGTDFITVTALVVDPRNPRTVYAGTWAGVYKSTDGGTKWTSVSAGMGDARIKALVIDPANSSVLYASNDKERGFSYGISKTSNGGASWSRVSSGLPGTLVRVIAVDPSNSSFVYAGTDAGVYASSDGGASWHEANAGLANVGLLDLQPSPVSPFALWAASEDLGVFTLAPGSLWSSRRTGIESLTLTALALDPSQGKVAYVGTRSGVFKTADGGAHWQATDPLLYRTIVTTLAVDPAAVRTLYMGVQNTGLFRSRDAGATWSVVDVGDNPWSRSPRKLCFAAANSQLLFMIDAGMGVLRSGDGGAHWQLEYLPGAAAAATHPTDARRAWALGRGSAWTSDDGGLTWANNPGWPPGTAASSLAVEPDDPRFHYAGTTIGPTVSASGVLASPDAGATWMAINAGLASRTVTAVSVDPRDPRTVYAATTTGGAFRFRRPTQPAIMTPCPMGWWVTGRPETEQLSVTGGEPPYTWSVAAGQLPTGLRLDPHRGVLSGKPLQAGSWMFTVRVTDALAQQDERACSLSVAELLTIPLEELPPAWVGDPYAYELRATGGVPPYVWVTYEAPPGLQFNRNGELRGTPTQAGRPGLGVRVFDASGQSAQKHLGFQIPARRARRLIR